MGDGAEGADGRAVALAGRSYDLLRVGDALLKPPLALVSPPYGGYVN